MKLRRVMTWPLGVTFLLAVLILAPCGRADGVSGSVAITGGFSNFVLSGNNIDGATGAATFVDNTGTAIFTGLGTNDITWGGNFTPPPGVKNFSELTFVGATVPNVSPGEVFQLGTLTYYNGTSAISSLIFGATFTLSAVLSGGGTASITPFTSGLGLVTTTNDGPTPASNADFVTFPTLGVSFNVLEGDSAQAILFGEIVGDPSLKLTEILIAPGSEGSGFIAKTPEPSSWIFLAAGLGLLAIVSKRVPKGLPNF